ncbi:MAG TPA: MOSC domain-containing protein [Solirubrobacteraceae bacterium]|nr:MOSC domain-containing protein [Solirubrobacteraceae bacterium]
MRITRQAKHPLPRGDSFAACVGAILEEPAELMPSAPPDGDPAALAVASRLLGSLGLGLVRVAEAPSFSWPGPWIARVDTPAGGPRFVVMFGVPSGVVFDPSGDGQVSPESIREGFLIAAGDIALARPPLPRAPTQTGAVQEIWISPAAGQPALARERVRALPGRGLEGDRHVDGRGTFPSGIPGSSLTLIEAEVCESFDPPLGPDAHRRNLVVRGIPLNDLVGHEFTVGDVRCRGMRLCEPCTVVQRYAGRPILRDLVHRGGLRADILSEGEIALGDPVRAA